MMRKRKSSSQESSKKEVPRSAKPRKDKNLFLEKQLQRKPSKCKLIICLTAIFIGAILLIYSAIPFLFRYSPTFRRSIVFMNYVNLQPFHNLSEPEIHYGLNCTRNFYIEDKNVKLGAWHVFPSERLKECISPNSRLFAGDFNDDRPVFLYFHGNGGTRGGNHRTKLYEVLAYSLLNAHVIAVDYRGYGDSSALTPSADGLFSDALTAYTWLTSKVNTSRLNVWGHSLGSAVSVQLASKLSTQSSPNSLILEGAFTTVAEAASRYPLSLIYRWWPCFDWFFIEPLQETNETSFDSMSAIQDVYSPLLFLHAKDDALVPIDLGQKLYNAALLSSKAKQKPKMITFNEHLNYGHKNIYRHKELTKIITDFIGLK